MNLRGASLRGATLALVLLAAFVAGCQSPATESRDESATVAPVAQRPLELAELRAIVGERVAAQLLVVGDRDDPAATLDVRLDVLLARTAEEQQRGLQGVTELPEGVGMLFVHVAPAGASGRPGFWMLETLIPLDIAFLVGTVSADGAMGQAQVVGVATMTPCQQRPCPITHPGVDYDAALEVRAGGLDAAGISVGSLVRWEAHSG